jgi:glutamate-5-semialdehyde dehydrogenase
MAVAVDSVQETCRIAKRAARLLAGTDTATRNRALEAIAAALIARAPEILAGNRRDMQAGIESSLSEALLDRLLLDQDRLTAIADAVAQIVALPDPVGEVIDGHRLPNGLDVRKVRVPLGVIAVVYEARPNVTIDATALCLKSGNAIVLRGSSTAAHSNAALAAVAGEAAVAAGLPAGCVSLLSGDYDELSELATQKDYIDLIIPRGGERLKAALEEVATIPVIYAASGNCHVFVDASADLEQAERIVLNAKTQRPGVCNAAEKLLVHSSIAPRFLPRILASLRAAGVQLCADERTRALAGADGDQRAAAGAGSADGRDQSPSVALEPAEEADWGTEYLALKMALAVVDSVQEAIEHIGRYGSGHSEAIVTRDTASARAFQLGVDAACVYVNASTRFTDGGEFGMGAEIGNSTQKLHARGPIGLRELCTFKYLVEGDGQIRA